MNIKYILFYSFIRLNITYIVGSIALLHINVNFDQFLFLENM